VKIPEFEERLDKFEKMLVVRSMREDRTLLAVQDYIIGALGKQYMDSRPLDLRATSEETTCKVPCIALLSMGADPTGPISDLAKKKKKQVLMISMGQGQEPARASCSRRASRRAIGCCCRTATLAWASSLRWSST